MKTFELHVYKFGSPLPQISPATRECDAVTGMSYAVRSNATRVVEVHETREYKDNFGRACISHSIPYRFERAGMQEFA